MGDANSKISHCSTVVRRARNRISAIKNENDELVEDPTERMRVFKRYFENRWAKLLSFVYYKFRNAFAQSIATECGFLKAISLRGLSVLPVLSFGQLFLLRKVPSLLLLPSRNSVL